MSIKLPNGKISLTLPEQVGKNTRDIDEIKIILQAIDALDNVIRVSDISEPLTSEDLLKIGQPICFIMYNNKVFIKQEVAGGVATFQTVFSMSYTTRKISISNSKILVYLNTGTLSYSGTDVSTYRSETMDTELDAKASKTYVDGELANKANLAGASFTGAVTAPTLKQSQYNYSRSFDLTTVSSLAITNVYNRFAEINNLLHLIVNIKITNNSGASVTLGSGYGFIATAVLSLDHGIAGKLIDMDGNSAADVGTNSTLIASEPCQVLKSKTLGDNTVFYTGRLSLVNRSAADSVSVQVALNGNTADRITIADGETIFVTARMSLTLI